MELYKNLQKLDDFFSQGWKALNEPLNNLHIKFTIKFEGDRVFVWGCFTFREMGYLYRIDEGLDAKMCQKILDENFMETLKFYNLNKLNKRSIIINIQNLAF